GFATYSCTYGSGDYMLTNIYVLPEYQSRNYLYDEFSKILDEGLYKNLAKTRYVNDKQITDHYAIIPTGQGFGNLKSLSALHVKVYEVIVRRFLAIFLPAAEFMKNNISVRVDSETFNAGVKTIKNPGYLEIMKYSFTVDKNKDEDKEEEDSENSGDISSLSEIINSLKKGDSLDIKGFEIKEGETTPPKRYNSGSMILAMENAGQLIEDEELRAQIKSCGIGTSATRAEILNKLVTKEYIKLNKKTQILTPTLMGELIFDIVNSSIRSLLNPELTASWEKGLNMVAQGEISSDEYMVKLTDFVKKKTDMVKNVSNQYQVKALYNNISAFYK
ncbi:MAG: type IA DNA topoisomerase, partial [Lachnospiraceae bacterium]|nr:type IA DNA topoisomerase [Lachnospiraceae bacterium]